MRALALIYIVMLCSTCGGEKSTCEKYNDVIYGEYEAYCSSQTCCYCECIRKGQTLDIPEYEEGVNCSCEEQRTDCSESQAQLCFDHPENCTDDAREVVTSLCQQFP